MAAGESYAGVYVPTLAQAIVQGNDAGHKPHVNIQVSMLLAASGLHYARITLQYSSRCCTIVAASSGHLQLYDSWSPLQYMPL